MCPKFNWCALARGAQLEVEELRRRNGQAETRIAELQRDNAELRMRLGLAAEDSTPKRLPWREGDAAEHEQQDGGATQQHADNTVIIEEAEDAAEQEGMSGEARGGKEAAVEID
jgi:hypothetical protein